MFTCERPYDGREMVKRNLDHVPKTKVKQTIREATKKINKLLSSQKPDGELPPEVESKIEEIRQIIRRCETSKAKAEARVEILKEGGVDVEDYSKALEEEIIEENAEMPLSRSGSSLSVKEEV
ncbi:hypothetical protein Avbf_07349 [Armadillidium vulgare]|nr:hypothetical protein Avbf_07349 [Armadillidium vulgare]